MSRRSRTLLDPGKPLGALSAHEWLALDVRSRALFGRSTSAYKPHQGTREMARRRKQLAAQAR